MDCLIHHMLQSSASRLPDKEALVDEGARLSFQTAAKNVAGLAEGLRQAGLRRGDRVGIYLETSVLQSLSIFGVPQACGVFVPINGLLFPQQVAHIARDWRMRGLITTREKLTSLSSVLADVPSLDFVMVAGEGSVSETHRPIYDLIEMFGSTVSQTSRELFSPTDVEEVLFSRNRSSSSLIRSPESQTLSKAAYCVRPPLSEFATEH